MRNNFSRHRKRTKHGKYISLRKAQQKKETEKTEILMEKRRQKKKVLQKLKKIHFSFFAQCLT